MSNSKNLLQNKFYLRIMLGDQTLAEASECTFLLVKPVGKKKKLLEKTTKAHFEANEK